MAKERTTGPDPDEDDNCPECGRQSAGNKVCRKCIREYEG